MLSSLLILVLTALYCALTGMVPRLAGLARWPAVIGVGAALAVSLWREGLPAGGMASVTVAWPIWLLWLGDPVYISDSLSVGLGAWCLVLGLLALLMVGSGVRAPLQLANAVAITATLYSLAHTDHLLAYAGQLFLLTALILASQGRFDYSRSMVGLGIGAVLLLGAVLLMGRTMGGVYSLSGLSLSALSVWPLALLSGFALLWLGMPPATGWSARFHGGDNALAALIQATAIGLPVFTLLLRLQGLVSAQALAGTVPEGWSAFMSGLSWLGAAGALVTSAGLLVWAGSSRWTGLLTAFAMSLALWALCQDNPLGRLSGLAILLAYSAGRMMVELSRVPSSLPDRAARAVAVASLAAAPISPMFVGVWLLASLLSGAHHPGTGVLLAGAVILAACGVVLHYAGTAQPRPDTAPFAPSPLSWVNLALGAALALGGAAPGLWVPYVARMAEAGGGTAPVDLPWEGLSASGVFVPVLLLAISGIVLAGLGWLVAAWARSGANTGGVLLPTGLDRIEKAFPGVAYTGSSTWEGAARTLLADPPVAVWWLSLTWLEGGMWGFGALFGRLGTRFGGLIGRLEGRFYLPLALILALVALLVAAR